jgi:hypothetical protein
MDIEARCNPLSKENNQNKKDHPAGLVGSNFTATKKVKQKWFIIDRCCSGIFSLTSQKLESA